MGDVVEGVLDPLDITGRRKRRGANRALDAINQLEDPRFSLLDEEGNLRSNLRQTGQQFFGRKRLENLADIDSTSPIAQRLLNAQGFQNQQESNRLAAQGASGLRNTLTQLASRGGVDPGTRQRLAAQSLRNTQQGQQTLASNRISGTNNILANDANRSFSLLQQLASADRQDRQNDLAARIKESELQRQGAAARVQSTAQIQQGASKNFLGK